jgi:hypothetical protein
MNKKQPLILKTDNGEIRIHELKTWSEYYNAINHPSIKYRKTFEVRKNDRDFQVGDYLSLLEYDPNIEEYTGRRCFRLITYILDKQPYVPEGYVVMGLIEDVPSIKF